MTLLSLLSFVAAAGLVTCGSDDGDSGGSAATTGTESATTPPPETSATTPGVTDESATTEVPVPTDPGDDPCEPFGTLVTLELNDRCDGFTSGDPGEGFADALRRMGYWVDESCPDGVLVVAQRQEVLVTVTDPSRMSFAVGAVQGSIEGSKPNDDLKTNLAQVVSVPDSELEDVLALLPTLQGEGWSADLNYLEPLQPNYGFRPADDPHTPPAGAVVPDSVPVSSVPSILILDSTADTTSYDVPSPGNGFVDEDHGHGVFVESIIKRQAAGANVILDGVTSSAALLPSGRWAPMMFTDFDLLRAMEPHFVEGAEGFPFDVVNLSLGGSGCTATSQYTYGVGERLSLARAMETFLGETDMKYVAAAGNDHGLADGVEIKHFPAAWRDVDATEEMARAVDAAKAVPGNAPVTPPAPTPEGDEIRNIHVTLTNAMIAVGAGDGLDYTNCGAWINAVAQGTEIGTYGTRVAQWSGTSFATANESALVARGILPADTLPC